MPRRWTVREVGDGNLNLVFIVEGDAGSVIVKQALPYVRLVGDSWPLPLKRAFFEYHALIRQEARDPGSVPKVLHFDEDPGAYHHGTPASAYYFAAADHGRVARLRAWARPWDCSLRAPRFAGRICQ
jgi:hypothetical protein